MTQIMLAFDLRGNELGNDGAIILGRGLRWVQGWCKVAGAPEGTRVNTVSLVTEGRRHE